MYEAGVIGIVDLRPVQRDRRNPAFTEVPQDRVGSHWRSSRSMFATGFCTDPHHRYALVDSEIKAHSSARSRRHRVRLPLTPTLSRSKSDISDFDNLICPTRVNPSWVGEGARFRCCNPLAFHVLSEAQPQSLIPWSAQS